jgi:hypothetical protein
MKADSEAAAFFGPPPKNCPGDEPLNHIREVTVLNSFEATSPPNEI